jgi:hypothetical protein
MQQLFFVGCHQIASVHLTCFSGRSMRGVSPVSEAGVHLEERRGWTKLRQAVGPSIASQVVSSSFACPASSTWWGSFASSGFALSGTAATEAPEASSLSPSETTGN